MIILRHAHLLSILTKCPVSIFYCFETIRTLRFRIFFLKIHGVFVFSYHVPRVNNIFL